jgi:hypothetical protein
MKIVFPHSSLIASRRALEFKQGEIIKHGDPLIRPEHPWEGNLAYLYGSVVRTKIYRMWYQAHGIYLAYARSRDGINWQKPLLKGFRLDQPKVGPTVGLDDGGKELCAPISRSRLMKSNVVADLHMPSLIYDPDDRARPYKLFGYTDRGYCAAFSKDGIHFKPAAANPVIPLMKFPARDGRKTWFSDVAPVFKDSRTGKYVSHVKTYQCDREGRTRRCVGYAESKDFLHWSKPVTIWGPGKDEDRLARERGFKWADFYGLCAFNYGEGYLGLLWLFYIDHEIDRGTHEGKIEVYLATSNDGKSWKRFSDSPLIPLNHSGWDTGMITTASQPLFAKDKILLYYGGANFSHGVDEKENLYDQKTHRFNIGRATLRKDGFVYAESQKGHLTTKALEIRRGRIRVNADCTRGKLLIDVVYAGRKAKSFEISGTDTLDHTLRAPLKGKIVLKVGVENAKLYSLEVL